LAKDVASKGDNASHFGQKQEKHIILEVDQSAKWYAIV